MSIPLDALNDNETSRKRNSMSMSELVANKKSMFRKNRSYYNQNRTEGDRVVAVKSLEELASQLPEVKTEADVEVAADFLVRVFHAPTSKAFYCDCVRHIRDREFLKRAITLSFAPRVKNPAAYFGRICTSRLVKLGIYK